MYSNVTTGSLDGWDLLYVAPSQLTENLWLIIERQATWVFVILGNTYDINTSTWRTDADQLISSQEFWFALGMTVLYVHRSFSCFDIYS